MGEEKCYLDSTLNFCSKDLYVETTVYTPVKGKSLSILAPWQCVPTDYSLRINFFKQMKDVYGFCLFFTSNLEQIHDLITAGWKKSELVISGVYTLADFDAWNENADRWMHESYPDYVSTTFHAIVIDEPHKYPDVWYTGIDIKVSYPNYYRDNVPVPSRYNLDDDFIINYSYTLNDYYRGIKASRYSTEFVISEYYIPSFSPGRIFQDPDWRFVYRGYADSIADDSYDYNIYDSVWGKIDLAGFSGKRAWISLRTNKYEFERLFILADKFSFTELWLYAGNAEDFQWNCDDFLGELNYFVEHAVSSGWLEKTVTKKLSSQVFCRKQDCRACIGKDENDPNYWALNPLGPPCSKKDKIEILL